MILQVLTFLPRNYGPQARTCYFLLSNVLYNKHINCNWRAPKKNTGEGGEKENRYDFSYQEPYQGISSFVSLGSN